MSIFSKKIIGLDISDNTMEVVLLEKKGEEIFLISKNRKQIRDGIIKRGLVLDSDYLIKEIRDLLNSAKPDPIKEENVIFVLPESQIYLHNFILEEKNTKELDKIVKNIALENFPIEEGNLNFSYRIVKDQKDQKEILVIGVSKKLINVWQSILDKAGLDVAIFDPESLAAVRSIFSKKKLEKPTCLIDMGATNSSVLIFNSEGFRYSHDSRISGENIDIKISEELNISITEAKKEKENSNLSKLKSKSSKIIIDEIDKLVSQIKETFQYIKDRDGYDIDEVVLIGGLSRLKGLKEYFNKELNINVEIGDTELINPKAPLEYITAIGAAIRFFGKKWEEKDPYFDPIKDLIPSIKMDDRDDDKKNNYKSKKETGNKKIRLFRLLLVILTFASVLFVYFYFSIKNKPEIYQREIFVEEDSFENIEKFEFEIPVAVSVSEYDDSNIRGKIIENQILFSGTYQETLGKSKLEIMEGLSDEQILWQKNINSELENEIDEESYEELGLLSFRWLVVEKTSLDSFLDSEILESIEKKDYEINDIKQIEIIETENSDIFVLKIDVRVSF